MPRGAEHFYDDLRTAARGIDARILEALAGQQVNRLAAAVQLGDDIVDLAVAVRRVPEQQGLQLAGSSWANPNTVLIVSRIRSCAAPAPEIHAPTCPRKAAFRSAITARKSAFFESKWS